MKATAYVTMLMALGWLSSAQAETPVRCMIANDYSNHFRIFWPTVPGKVYALKTTTNLARPWQTRTNVFTATTNLLAYGLTGDATSRFFKVVKLDTEPPEVQPIYPPDGAVGVNPRGVLQARLEDETGINTNSLRFSLGNQPSLSLADPRLSFTNGVLTYTPAPSEVLGTVGTTVIVRISATDILGNSNSNLTWSFQLCPPGTPVLRGRWPGFARGDVGAVAVVGSYAYATLGYGGLAIYNISNPANPVRVGGYDTHGAQGVQVVGNYAYVADGYAGLQVIDVSNPANPVRIGGYDTSGSARGVHVLGSYAYVADNYGGLRIIDVSNPANPAGLGRYVSNYVEAVHVVGYLAYATSSAGLEIINVGSPSHPSLAWFAYLGYGSGQGVHVSGNYAYIADRDAGLQIINVSDPANPVGLSRYATGGSVVGVHVVSNHAYVADWYGGLHILNVGNPANPVRLGGYFTRGEAYGVHVVGNYAYVADDDVLQILNVSNRGSPVRVGSCTISDDPRVGDARAVQVTGNYAYVASGSAGLQVVRVSNPANPVRVGGYVTSGYAYDVHVVGNYAYVADSSASAPAGLQIIDVGNPANPVWVARYDSIGFGFSGVQVVSNYAYAADLYGGLQVVDVRNAANPVRVGGYVSTRSARDVHVVGSYAYLVFSCIN